MIDIHAHILPNLDDGPLSLAEAVNLVREAKADGITAIFATPHAYKGVFHCTPEQILEKCSLLTEELRKQDIVMDIMPGSEVHLTNNVISHYDNGRLLTLNNLGSHILLELPEKFIFEAVTNILQDFAYRGVTVIIAHPERNTTLRKNVHLIPDMIDEGAMMQVTAASIVGGFGKKIMKITEKMIANDHVTLVGSDIHPFRDFMMRKALRKVLLTAGRKTAEEIFKRNAESILIPNEKRAYAAM
ncbi:MAG: tyrosine protein phosphatase [Desulfobulbaceae bacterium]|nr:tyrosine protein phosphatase [Desulfobulbaceae bacterium]